MSDPINVDQDDLCTMSVLTTASNYQFSAVDHDALGASQYTLVTIAIDASSSVAAFKKALEDCISTIIKACQGSPRSENIMVRVITFNSGIVEVHGFKPLASISVDDYVDSIYPSGMTALCDATQSSVEATQTCGLALVRDGYDVNGVVYILTDGQDNHSTATENTVRKSIETEAIYDLTVVLIGVNTQDPSYLDGFKNNCGITQYSDIGDASPSNLGKLGKMVSKSISSISTSLSNGQNASQSASSLLSF